LDNILFRTCCSLFISLFIVGTEVHFYLKKEFENDTDITKPTFKKMTFKIHCSLGNCWARREGRGRGERRRRRCRRRRRRRRQKHVPMVDRNGRRRPKSGLGESGHLLSDKSGLFWIKAVFSQRGWARDWISFLLIHMDFCKEDEKLGCFFMGGMGGGGGG